MRTLETGVWLDATSYSQRDADRTPRTWSMRIGGMRLTVTRHIHYPGCWIMKCEPFFSHKDLGSVEAETAKATALGLVWAELNTEKRSPLGNV